MIIATIICLLLTFIIYLHLSVYNLRRKYAHIPSLPFRPFYLYYMGHLPLLSKLRKMNPEGASLEGAFIQPVRKELNADTFMIFFNKRCILVTQDLPKVSAVLSDHTMFKKTKNFRKNVSQLNGISVAGQHGLLVEPGSHVWYTKRKILDPAFHKKYLKITMDSMVFVSNKVVEYMRDNTVEGDCINMFPLLGRTAMEIVSRSGFNIDIDMIQDEDSQLYNAIQMWTKCMGLKFKHTFTWDWYPFHRKDKDEFAKAMIPTRRFLRQHAEERIASDDTEDDILSHIIKANSFSDQLTVEDTVDDFLTFFLAGMETTANSMSFVLWYLIKNEEVYTRLQEEVDEVYSGKSDLHFDDIPTLTYMDQVIKEVMRLSPPVLATSRQNVESVMLGDLLLPKETIIRISQWALQTDPRHWENPLVFNPDNFASNKKIKPFTYMPFMAGPRSCIGRNFAVLEMKIILSKLLRHFTFIDSDPENTVLETTTDITCKPKHGVLVRVKERAC